MKRVTGLRSGSLLIPAALCLLGFCLPSLLGAAEIVVPKPTAKDKCPVCGMFVAKYPRPTSSRPSRITRSPWNIFPWVPWWALPPV